MIDLHSHLLANLDDGSRSLDQSAGVLSNFVAAGITDVVTTPHLLASVISDEGEERIADRDRALAALRSAAPNGVRLHPGFEILLDEPLPAIALGDRRYALAGSRYYLVEFPLMIVGDLATTILARIADAGLVPIVAHPERYRACSVALVGRWRKVGARVQVDATTLTKSNARGQLARALIEAGMADVIAADNHGDRRTLTTGVAFLAGHGASSTAQLLARGNPEAVLRDEDLAPVEPVRLRLGFLARLKEWMA